MSETRRDALRRVALGDLFSADTEFGGTVLCLALAVTSDCIVARDIGRDGELRFDRASGVAPWPHDEGRTVSTIRSIAPLPPEVHETFLHYDRRQRPGRPLTPEEIKLTEAEKQAFVFIYDFYPAHPIDD